MHELLVAAGPPAELPSALARPPEQPDDAEVVPLSEHRRRPLATFLIAAAVAAACFGGGYVLANQAHQTSAIHVVRIVPMQGVGQQNSFASLRVGSSDANGNWPIQLTVAGLPALQQKERYYLMVWQNGKTRRLLRHLRGGRPRVDDGDLQRRLQDHEVDPLGRDEDGPRRQAARPRRHDDHLTCVTPPALDRAPRGGNAWAAAAVRDRRHSRGRETP